MGNSCPDGAQCNFCHFEHDTGKHVEIAMYAAVKKQHVQDLPLSVPPMKNQMHRDSSEAPTPALWLGSSSQSTELSDSDQSEVTHRSDPSEVPRGGGGELQDEATWPNRSTCADETMDFDIWWDAALLHEAEVQSFSI